MKALNSSAKDLTAWLNDNIVEAFIQTLIETYKKNAYVFSTTHATSIIRGNAEQVKIRRHLDKFDFLCGPVKQNNHWTLFMVDITRLEYIYIDPKCCSDEESSHFFTGWCNFAKQRNDFKKITQWSKSTIKHPIQRDNHECGVFILYFFSKLLNSPMAEILLDHPISDYRKIISESLLSFSTLKN